MATNLMIRINDGENTIDREMNAEEIAAHEQFVKDQKAWLKEIKDKETAKAALLVKLGITAEEAALLLS